MADQTKPYEASVTAEEGVSQSRSRDFTMKKNTGVSATLLLGFTSLGVIYGDIGTSPLYVLNAIFPSSGRVPTEEDVLGSVSAVIWAITIFPLIKYSLIALEFGNGSQEGGPFAIFSSLYPAPEEKDENRALTSYTTMTANHQGRRRILENPLVKIVLFLWCIFGTCLTISDGLLTPAVSVTSAVTGIAVAVPSVSSAVVGISIGILAILFLIQGFGTNKVGRLFAPIVFVWLALNMVSGIINITEHPGIFRAFDPSRAVALFIRTRDFDLLAGVLLAITGVEALFANLGQFSKQSIRISFIGYVYPCLIFAYLGQGAKLIAAPEQTLQNVFFQSVPGGVKGPYWWITWIIAVLSAVIASQAMITATFSLVQQLTRLRVMPSVKVVHTDDKAEGQIYVPVVNFLLMLGTIGVTAGFGTDAALTNAYGFAVSGVLIVTTSFIAIAVVDIKGFPLICGILFFIVAAFFDSLFFGAALKKVPHGAWFPLSMAVLLTVLFQSYSWAKNLEIKFDRLHRYRLQEVVGLTGNGYEKNSVEAEDEKEGSSSVPTVSEVPPMQMNRVNIAPSAVADKTPSGRLNVMAFFHSSSNAFNGAPESFASFIRSYPSLPEFMVFFNVRIVHVPHTEGEDRLFVSRVRSFSGVYIATLRLGYRDDIDLSQLAQPMRAIITDLEQRAGSPNSSQLIAKLDKAMEKITHILPHFHVTSDPSSHSRPIRLLRQFLIESVYRRVAVNFDEFDSYKFGASDNVLRIGVPAAL